MRIWDIHPGYLNRQSLLGEHRELHGIHSILVNNKKGYSTHPETLRWKDHLQGLSLRHAMLRAEMVVRGYKDNTPLAVDLDHTTWPESYIDPPARQFVLLTKKYVGKEQGRMPMPRSAQQLWAQHKYSIMARDVSLYKAIGKEVAPMRPRDPFDDLALRLSSLLRTPPPPGGITNALQHMWGHVADDFPALRTRVHFLAPLELWEQVAKCTQELQEPYLMHSTALSDLKVWISL